MPMIEILDMWAKQSSIQWPRGKMCQNVECQTRTDWVGGELMVNKENIDPSARLQQVDLHQQQRPQKTKSILWFCWYLLISRNALHWAFGKSTEVVACPQFLALGPVSLSFSTENLLLIGWNQHCLKFGSCHRNFANLDKRLNPLNRLNALKLVIARCIISLMAAWQTLLGLQLPAQHRSRLPALALKFPQKYFQYNRTCLYMSTHVVMFTNP